MSSIKLTDNFGFSMEVTNEGDKSNFFKRLLTDAEFVFDTANVEAVQNVPLGADPGPGLPFTLTAKGSAGIGEKGAASLKIDGTCKAKLSKSIADDCSKVLKPFLEELPAGADQKSAGYLTFETSVEVNTGINVPVNDFTFGLTKGRTVTLSNSRFFPQLAATKLTDATRALLSDFVILGDLSDIQALPLESICSAGGKGSLKFKGSVGYQFFTNPLASVEIPVAGPLALKAVGNATVTFTVTLDAGFNVSVLKNSEHTARITVERSRDIDFDTGIEINAQVTANVMGQDLLSLVLSAISPDPDVEIKKMDAKLDDASRSAINDAIKSAIKDNFELALQGDIETKFERDTLFLYELDLNALSTAGKAALQNALHGDFTGLAEAAATQRDGVTELQSVLTTTKTRTRRLTVHLLNVFQAGSVSALISKETVKATPSGDLAITDTQTARSTEFASFPAQTDGLRKLLFTSATITAAYKGTKTQLGAPEITCELVHFEYDRKAGADELRRNVNALEMLQVLPEDVAASALQGTKNQKASASNINISLKLSADDCERLFSEGGKARGPDVYESAGKAAMYRLIASDPNQTELAQLLTTAETALWNKLKAADTLSATAIALGNGSDTLRAQPYFTEVSRIKWWTEHMSNLAKCVEAFESAGAKLDPNSDAFRKLHNALNSEARQVSSLSEDYFKLPWGILAISQVLGFSPKADVILVSQALTFKFSAPAEPAKVAAAR